MLTKKTKQDFKLNIEKLGAASKIYVLTFFLIKMTIHKEKKINKFKQQTSKKKFIRMIIFIFSREKQPKNEKCKGMMKMFNF